MSRPMRSRSSRRSWIVGRPRSSLPSRASISWTVMRTRGSSARRSGQPSRRLSVAAPASRVVYSFTAMVQSMPVLVAPEAFGGGLRAPVVAAAIGRGLERAGCAPPELCPVAGGGPGTIEVLLPALGGETGDGFALVEDGATALVEHGATSADTGLRVVAAVGAGAQVVVLCGDGTGSADVFAGAADAGSAA